MLFWIMVALAVVAVVVVAYWNFNDGLNDVGEHIAFTFLGSLIACLTGAFATFLLCLAGYSIFGYTYTDVHRTDTPLYSLSATGDVSTGRLYLLGGYIHGERQFNYVVRGSDGGFRLESSNTDDSVVYYSKDAPHVVVSHHSYGNPWLTPFDVETSTSYKYYVPSGSVKQDYTVDNSK